MDLDRWIALLGSVAVPLLGILAMLVVNRRQAVPAEPSSAESVARAASPSRRRAPSFPPEFMVGRDQTFPNKYKGYYPHWHLGPGSYRSKRDFLWLEFECDLGRPARVATQVEGPARDEQADVNANRIERALAIRERIERLRPGLLIPVERNGKSEESDMIGTRSTSLYFHDMPVDPGLTEEEAARQAIWMVFEALAQDLDEVWRSFGEKLT